MTSQPATTTRAVPPSLPAGALRGAGPLLIARIVSGFATVGMFAGLARFLSVDQFGLFAFAWSAAYIIGSIAEGGYGMVVIRDVAQSPSQAGRYLGALIPIRAAVLGPAVAIGVAVGWLVVGSSSLLAIGLATLAAYLQLTAQTGRDFLIPSGSFGLVSALSIVENIGRLAIVLLAAAWSGSVVVVFGVSAVVYGCSVAATYVFVVRRLRPRGVVAGSRSWRPVASSTVSFGVFVTLAALYLHIHAVVATLLLPLASVAMIQITLRLFFSAEYLPEAVARWAYPHLSRAVRQPDGGFAALSTVVTGRLVITGAGVGALLIVTAPWLVPAIFGDAYSPAVVLVQISAIAIPLRYASHAYGTSLSAGGRQLPRVAAAAIAITVTVAGELILVGTLSEVGIVASLVLGTAVLVIGYFIALRRGWPGSISPLPVLGALVSCLGLGTLVAFWT